MITRIEIDGFKSLQGVAVDLEPLTAVFGANGSGKSNLFDALHLLSSLAEADVATAFKRGRGRPQDQFTRLTQYATADRIAIAVEVLVPRTPPWADQPVRFLGQLDALKYTRLRYELTIERRTRPDGTETLDLPHESVRTIAPSADPWVVGRSNFASFSAADDGVEVQLLRAHRSEAGERLELQQEWDLPPQANPMGLVLTPAPLRLKGIVADANLVVQPHLAALRSELAGWRFLRLDAQGLRSPSNPVAPPLLLSDGSNLPTALASLSPEVRGLVRADMAALVPGFRSFEVVPMDGELAVVLEFSDGQRVPARVLSDGTLRLLATVVLLRSVPPGTMVALEEPENGIHPGRLRALVERLRALATPEGDALPTQVLLNSHSPVLLAALHDEPASVLLADLVRHGTGPRVTRLRHVQANGGGGQPTASMREVDRILETAHVEGST